MPDSLRSSFSDWLKIHKGTLIADYNTGNSIGRFTISGILHSDGILYASSITQCDPTDLPSSTACRKTPWETYANSKLGFEFQYPSSFGILNPVEYIHTSAEKLKNNPDSVVFLGSRLVMSSGVSYNGTTGQPMTFTEVTSSGSNKKQIIVDGIKGIEVSSPQIGTIILIPLSGNTIFEIDGSPDLLDQILPTFKFNP